MRRGEGEFKYYGNYRKSGAPDRLGGNELTQVPNSVLKHWAKHISSKDIVEELRVAIGAMRKYRERPQLQRVTVTITWRPAKGLVNQKRTSILRGTKIF